MYTVFGYSRSYFVNNTRMSLTLKKKKKTETCMTFIQVFLKNLNDICGV